ncbi:MAG: hypothetical protein KH409_00340, partial [Clostridium sp.]|nr:hypothetical protein [Clostridium sp.]
MLDNIKQKLKRTLDGARNALKRTIIRTRRRSAAFRRAGGMRRAMDSLIDGVRNRQPRALITLGSAAAAVIAVAVIIISATAMEILILTIRFTIGPRKDCWIPD